MLSSLDERGSAAYNAIIERGTVVDVHLGRPTLVYLAGVSRARVLELQ